MRTILALLAMAGAGLSYWAAARIHSAALLGVVLSLEVTGGQLRYHR